MSVQISEDVQEGSATNRSEKPFFTLPLNDKSEDAQKKVHAWLMGELEWLKSQNRDRLKQVERNLALYKGIQFQTQETRTEGRDRTDDRSRVVQKIVAPHLYDLSKSRAAKLLKYKPYVAILPANDELSDKISAKMTKGLLDHIQYVQRYDGVVLPRLVRNTQPSGECYLFVEWDPELGDVNPAYKAEAAGAEGGRVPLMGESGEQEVDDQGKPVWIDKPVKNGDVCYKIRSTIDVFPERPWNGEWESVRHIFWREFMPVEEARLLWPRAADKIKGNKDAVIYDYEKMQETSDKAMVEVWFFAHKRYRTLDKGRSIVFTRDGVLSSTDFPYSHYSLPCVRITDVDIPGELHGRSFFDFIKGLTGADNNMLNMVLRNIVLAGHPKWMLPHGSADKKSLGNDITIVSFKGPVSPQLVSMQTTGPEVFKLMESLRETFQRYADVGMTSRGEPPPGVVAAVAMQFLSELENERWNEAVLKYNEANLQIAIMTLAVAGDYYDASDERTIRLLGKNNQWMGKFFDVAHLSKDYDIRIQSSSALPESKSARIQYVIELAKEFPGIMTNEQVINILDLAQSDKFVTEATTSLTASEAENEQLLDEIEEDIPEPQEYEDHITHWRTHVRKMREWAFKNQTPPEIQARFEDHVMTTEALMAQKAIENPLYLQELAKLPGFPVLFAFKSKLPPEVDTGAALVAGELAAGQLPPEPQMPTQAPGEPVNVEPPSVDAQLAQEQAPTPGPVEPTSQI